VHREVPLILSLVMLVAASCKKGADDLPANLTPAAGETVRYSTVGARCPLYLQEFKGDDGAPAGATCVSHALLAKICRRATRCEEVTVAREKGLIDRSKQMRPQHEERDR
jgi:hypothetical protein